jgi:hypothetical protein
MRKAASGKADNTIRSKLVSVDTLGNLEISPQRTQSPQRLLQMCFANFAVILFWQVHG